MGKKRLEQWLWELAAAEINHLHSDNGIFNAELLVEDCKNKFQTQSFSGVGAHHQNAFAEQSIRTIMYMTRTFMVHVSLDRSKYGADNIALGDFAMKHAVWLHKCLPNHLSGLKTLELLTKIKANHCDLLHTHVWGCPVFVLDPKLQD